jgi:hypothetical protein
MRLANIGGTTSVGSRLAELAERVAVAQDLGEIQALLHEATLALGAERSFFASVSGEGHEASYAFVLDCDPNWWHQYHAACPVQNNPWFAYASRHSATVRGTQLAALVQAQQQAIDIAATAGFASAVLIPVHSGRADNRVSLLCLGHSVPGTLKIRRLQSCRSAREVSQRNCMTGGPGMNSNCLQSGRNFLMWNLVCWNAIALASAANR